MTTPNGLRPTTTPGPNAAMLPAPVLTQEQVVRFWSKIDVRGPDECWEWLAVEKVKGYGRFRVGPKKYLATRLAYALVHGFMPDTAWALHSCDNPPCCNPKHLRPGDGFDNARDRVTRRPGSWAKTTGERHGRAVLNEELVRTCRAEVAAGATVVSVAAKHGLNESTVQQAVTRHTWKHVA